MRWGRRKPDGRDADNTIYVHLATDGGVLVIRGDDGKERWMDRTGLAEELERIKDRPGASLLYSREDGQREPPDHVRETFEMIADYGLPIQLLEKPHWAANTPPGQRGA